jgi:predicted NBD/HSP70 family sugar kinase
MSTKGVKNSGHLPSLPRPRRARGIRRLDLSSVQLGSSEVARDINRDIILELIRLRQPLARMDLSRLSGLRPSTVSLIVDQLIGENWVREGGAVKGPRGRPSKMLTVNDEIVTFAMDLRPDRAILALVDLTGRFHSRQTIAMSSDPKTSMARVVERIRALQQQYSAYRFEGLGVSMPGRVDPLTQRVLLAPNLRWTNFDLKSVLESALGMQVELDNDANVCLLSELWYGRLENVQNVVLVAIAEGIGAAILSEGQLLIGHNGLAGEFGHLPVDPTGPKCGCGQRGCWEMFASSSAAIRRYNASARKEKVRDIYGLLIRAEEGDQVALQAMTAQAEALGRGLRLITASLSPELILITGEITAYWNRFGAIIEKALQESMLAGPAPRIAPAGDSDLARLSGAAALLLQRHARYHRSTHAPSEARVLPLTERRPATQPASLVREDITSLVS